MKHPNDTECFDMVCLKASESDLEYDVWLYSSGNVNYLVSSVSFSFKK